MFSLACERRVDEHRHVAGGAESQENRMGKFGVALLLSFWFLGCESEKKPVQSASQQPPVNLIGTHWVLEDIGGKPVIDGSKATLTFPEAGRVAGNGSCNRFMGSAEMKGDVIKIGPLAGTKMMCDPPASDQETAYLKALEGAQKFAVKGGKLLIEVAGSDGPLRFRAAAAGEN
jgi:heat shock protein HslJ